MQRVREPKPLCVQELPGEPEIARDAVDRIAAHGKPDRLEMHADLMRAPGLEPNVQERVLAKPLAHLEPRDGLAWRAGVERVPCAVAAVASDRGLDPSRCATAARPRTRAG